MNPFSHTGLSISDSLKSVRKSVLIYETIIDEEFSKILTENRSVVNKIKHIVALNYSQKTEVASLILNEVMSVKTEKERAVILAIALDIVTQSKLNGMTSMLNKIGIEIEQKK